MDRRASTIVRPASRDDWPAVLSLNNGAVPHVNALEPSQFEWLATQVDYFGVAEKSEVLVGFVMALRQGTEYWSANYAWFGARYSEFVYLDRVVVERSSRRFGVGRALYGDLIAFARDRWPRIALEVNVRPPNPGSIAFHEALGFQRVGTRIYDENEVAMFELPLARSG